MVGRIRRALGDGAVVTFATVEVLFCELRQAINRYGLRGVWYLVQWYQASSSTRAAVLQARRRLQLDDEVSMPHTVQLLEVVRECADVSLAALRRKRPRPHGGVVELAFQLGRHRICPKVEMGGIVEWSILARELSVSLSRGQCSYRDLRLAAEALEVSVYDCSGARKGAAVLRRHVAAARTRAPVVSSRRRTFAELQAEVSQAGGTPRPYRRGVRRRLTRTQLEQYLDEF